MAHFVDENDPNYNFKGWRFYLNSYTLRGRFNWVVLTWGTVAGLILFNKMRGKKKAAIAEK
jgi:hypothetical protein